MRHGFPEDFTVQPIGVQAAMAVSELPSADIALYFREHPEAAEALVLESYDKRYSPSTFITEGSGPFKPEGNGQFKVGWLSRGYECVRQFPNLADAATDYLLFSLGKGRWPPSEASNPK